MGKAALPCPCSNSQSYPLITTMLSARGPGAGGTVWDAVHRAPGRAGWARRKGGAGQGHPGAGLREHVQTKVGGCGQQAWASCWSPAVAGARGHALVAASLERCFHSPAVLPPPSSPCWSAALGPLACLRRRAPLLLREELLRGAGFADAFASVKVEENTAALSVLPGVLAQMDAEADSRSRCVHCIPPHARSPLQASTHSCASVRAHVL